MPVMSTAASGVGVGALDRAQTDRAQTDGAQTDGGSIDLAARGWLLCGLLGLTLTVVAGLWAGVLLAFAYRLPAGDAFQFGRLRPVHTRLALHLWLLPSALGVIRARVAAGAPGRLDRTLPWIWAALQLAACALIVLSGVVGPEYAEAPGWIDVAGAALLVVVARSLLRSMGAAGGGHERTGLLYAAEMLAWAVLLALFVSVVLPFVDGARAAALHRQWLADSIGLVVTPAAAAAAYLSLPATTGGASRRPLLGRIGFYALAFTYVLAGGRHALFGPQAASLAAVGWVSSLAIAVPSAALAWNVLESVVRGRAPDRPTREAAAWLFAGGVLWLLLATQGAVQSIPSVSAAISKTDWVVGHAHLALFGAVGALVVGAVQAVVATGPAPPRRASLVLRGVWVAAALGMLWALCSRSFLEAEADLAGIPYATRFGQIQGMWHTRLAFGLLLIVPLLVWVVLAARTLLRASASRYGVETRQRPARPACGRALFAVGAGAASLGLVFALTPGEELGHPTPRTEVSARGLAVFRREGCIACHTRAARDLPSDLALYGEPTLLQDSPAQPGTRRIGPDLAAVGQRRSRAWLRAHLETPSQRVLSAGHDGVARTAMPSFSHLPAADLDALVEWLAASR